MTDDQIRAALDIYRAELLKRGASRPMRSPERPTLNHLLWVCNEVERHIDEGRRSRAMCDYGFLQGALWWARIRSIADLRLDDRGVADLRGILP